MSYRFTAGGGGQSWNGGDFTIAETNTFTVFGWAKPATLGAAHAIVGKWGPSAFCFNLDISATGFIRANAAGAENLTGVTSATANIWHPCAMRKNGTGASGLTAWIDGAIDATGTSATSQSNTTDDFRIGDDGFVGNDYMDGWIAHVAVWSIALTDGELVSLSGGANPLDVQAASLVCYYPLTQNLSVYPDASTNGAPSLTTSGTGMSFSTDNPTVDPPPIPEAFPDWYDMQRNGTLTVVAGDGVLVNDIGQNTLESVLDTDVTNGVLNLDTDGSFDYTPDTGFVGVDTFTYHAHDTVNLNDSDTVTVTVTVYGDGIEFQTGSGDYTDAAVETLDVELPGGLTGPGTEGRLLLALVVFEEASQGTGAGITFPAGYTKVYGTDQIIDPTLTARHFWNIGYRETVAVEPSTETFVVEGGVIAQAIGVVMASFTNADIADLIDALGQNTYTDVSNLFETAPAVNASDGTNTQDRVYEWSTSYSDGAAATMVLNALSGGQFLLNSLWADVGAFPYSVEPPEGIALLSTTYGDGSPRYGMALAGVSLALDRRLSFDMVFIR